MHPLLVRQLKRLGLETARIPQSPDAWQKLLERVNRSYIEADQGRELVHDDGGRIQRDGVQYHSVVTEDVQRVGVGGRFDDHRVAVFRHRNRALELPDDRNAHGARHDHHMAGDGALLEHQAAHVQKMFDAMTTPHSRRVLLQGWEQFHEPVDRIVSIGAFEHFGRAKYAAFFARCRAILPDRGVMLLHTITAGKPSQDWDFLRFVHFIATEIFPGGDVPSPESVIAAARAAGFELVHAESLRPHYARTLDCWAANLESRRADAVALVGEKTCEKYMKYLTGCAALFRSGECNVHQFKLRTV